MSSLPSAKGAVTDPIERDRKEQDVERKLRLYTTVNALRESKLPANKQLDSWLDLLQQNLGSDGHSQKLSRQGQKLTTDLRDIFDTIRLFLKKKNGDELIQEVIWNTRDIETPNSIKSEDVAKDGHVLGVNKDKAQQDAQEAAHSVRTLLHLLLTNSEARKLLSDFSVVGRDLLARGLGKASEGLRPDEDQLRLVDEAHRGEGGAFSVASPEQRAREQEEIGVDGMAKARVPSDIQDSVNAVAEEASRTQDAAQNTARDARGQEISPSSPREAAEDVKEEAKKRGLMDRVKNVRNAIPDEHQEKAKDHFKRGKEFLTEEYFPKERRDQWIWRGKKVILECQSHPEYQSSLRWLLAYIKEYASHGRRIANDGGAKATEGVKGNGDLQGSMAQLRALTERFANGRSMQDDIWDPINALIDDAQRDQEFRQWWSEIDEWIEKVLLTPGYVIEPASSNRGRELFESGKRFYGSGQTDDEVNEPQPLSGATGSAPNAGTSSYVPYQVGDINAAGTNPTTQHVPGAQSSPNAQAPVRGKYREHFDNVFDGIGKFVGGIGSDPLNRQFGTDIQRLTKDLLFDSDGKLTFKPELWNDVRTTIIPGLIQRIGVIPIPRIEYTDDSLDLVLENLTMSAQNLFPNLVEVEVRNWARFGSGTVTGKKDTSKDIATNKHSLHLHLSQIQTDMRDVAFYFRKKSGLPKLKDSGVADVLLGGDGLSATIHLESSSDPTTLYDIKNIAVKVDTLKFAIRDSKHDLLYKTLRPLATGLIKKQVQKAVADGMRTGLEWLGEELIAVRDRMNEAREGATEEEEVGRFKAMQEAFKRRKDDASSTVSRSGSSSQFKVVSNKRNSLLATAGHPSGWVNRVDEKEKTIHELPAGERGGGGQDTWRTKAFDINA
ncbi:hypothetical protein DFJ43DRAFT_1071512 [Lentinula guzmanii]|uniref:Uncharacterized protein n=1 Tax=Lentinula guzmanii TaxID=2804957 RepID=A0AA38JNL6_9AGAR|nr:hypothetical protein DFJ43DRAFT_1071512 [Lentinula guzmanii]